MEESLSIPQKKLIVLKQRYQGVEVLEDYRFANYRLQGGFTIKWITIKGGIIVFELEKIRLTCKSLRGYKVVDTSSVSPQEFITAYFHSINAYFHLQDFRVRVDKWSFRFTPNGTISSYAHF